MEQSDTQRLNELAAEMAALREQLIPFEVGVKGNLTGLIRDVTGLLNRVARIEAARVTPAEAREPVCNCTHRAEDHITGTGACNLCRCDQFDTFDPDRYPLAPEPAPTVALGPDVVVSRGDLYSILNIVSKMAKTRSEYDAYDRLIEKAGS